MSIRQTSSDKKQAQAKILSNAQLNGPNQASVPSASANITLDMKSETSTKRKESPTSITNIMEVLSPGPFSSSVLSVASADVRSDEATQEINTPSTIMARPLNEPMTSTSYASDGIASLPRNTRRRSQQFALAVPQINPEPSIPITRSKRLMIESPPLVTIADSHNFNLRSMSLPQNRMMPSYVKNTSSYHAQPLKKRKVKHPHPPLIYEFFGPTNPMVPKIIALRVLEFLNGKDFYSLSVTSSLWDSAAKDDALWET